MLVYGQTGAGKTHTMFGSDDEAIFGANLYGAGIVPRAMHDILAAMRERSHDIESQLSISYVEIFGENVIDLLRGGVRCGHSKVLHTGFTHFKIQDTHYLGCRAKICFVGSCGEGSEEY